METCNLCNRPILPTHQSLECDGKQYHRDESECIRGLVAELEQARKWSSAWKKLARFSWRVIMKNERS